MINDIALRKAAAELATVINESLPDPKECVHQFSPDFEKKIKRLTRKARHPIIYHCLRNIASFLLIIIIGFCGVLAFSSDARATMFGWVKEQYRSFYEYFFEGEIADQEKTTYSPSWLPEDCKLVTSYKTSGGEVHIYSSAQESLIQFSYISDPDAEKLYMDGVDADKKTVMINGYPGELYISQNDEKTNNIVWLDESQTVLFSVSGDYSEEILIKIAENVEKK